MATDTQPARLGINSAMHHKGITMQTHRMLWGLKAPEPNSHRIHFSLYQQNTFVVNQKNNWKLFFLCVIVHSHCRCSSVGRASHS